MNNPRNLALAGVGVAGGIYLLGINPFNSYGSQNIGNAWSRAGGSQTHSPAIATPLGTAPAAAEALSTVTISREMGLMHVEISVDAKGQSAGGGIDSDHFKDKHMDQKVGQPGPIKKAMSNAHYGNENGK
ncbi:Essential protein-like protein Yae1 [Venturia nashicola]|uniref:Essential protein-like protein Yae1 n=1 Tax=Venturia nashicola TaxID=86259 RepID=A0A4Z1PFD8_9PEZI|nr:Essential protein-like protein Yae1 [Venturia nashicola]